MKVLTDRSSEVRRSFDPEGKWLIDHQNARPYGDETVPPDEEATGKGAAGAGAGGAPGAPAA